MNMDWSPIQLYQEMIQDFKRGKDDEDSLRDENLNVSELNPLLDLAHEEKVMTCAYFKYGITIYDSLPRSFFNHFSIYKLIQEKILEHI